MLLMKRANKAQMKIKKNLVIQETMIYKKTANTNGLTDNLNGYNDMPDNLLKPEACEDSEFSYKQSNSLNLILKELQFITRKIKNDDEEDDKSQDWKFTAMVVDRLCLVFFALATFISTAAILLTAKNFFKFR